MRAIVILGFIFTSFSSYADSFSITETVLAQKGTGIMYTSIDFGDDTPREAMRTVYKLSAKFGDATNLGLAILELEERCTSLVSEYNFSADYTSEDYIDAICIGNTFNQ